MSEHEGTEAWLQGVRDSIAWVKYRQSVLADLQHAAYKAALADVLVHLEAMLARGTARSTTPVASAAPWRCDGCGRDEHGCMCASSI